MPFIYLTDAGRDLPAPVQERVGTCLEHGLHCLIQTVGVHAVAGVEEFWVRDRDEVVRAAAADQLAGNARLCDTRADQLAKTAEQVVVLRCDDAAGFCGVNNGLLVKRFDREHIDNADLLAQLIVDALGGFHGKVTMMPVQMNAPSSPSRGMSALPISYFVSSGYRELVASRPRRM